MSELLLAPIPLKHMLNPKAVTKAQIIKGVRLQDIITTQIKAILQGQEPSALTPLSFADLDSLREQIEDLNLETVMQNALPQLARAGIDTATSATWASVLAELQLLLPRDRVVDTGFKLETSPGTSRSLRSKFLWVARIADNPLWILQLFSKSQLSNFDVVTIQRLFPEIYGMMAETFITEIINTYKPQDPLPRRLKLMLSIFLQTPVLNIETAQAYQSQPKKKSMPDVKTSEAPDIKLSAGEV